MPRKPAYAYNYTRKKRKTKKKTNYGKSFVMKVPSGMPLQRRAYLRYSQGIALSSTLGALGHNIFRANGIYDPDSSGIGTQPLGRDQWAALFNHSCVVRCKITMTPVWDSNASVPLIYGITLTDDGSTPYTLWTGYTEAKKGSHRLHSANNQDNYSVTSVYDAKKFYNITDIKDNVDRLGAPIGDNPTEGAFFDCWLQPFTSTTHSQLFIIHMDFVVDFSEPKDLVQS